MFVLHKRRIVIRVRNDKKDTNNIAPLADGGGIVICIVFI